MDADRLYGSVEASIVRRRAEIVGLSRTIHGIAEIGLEEYKSVGAISDLLSEVGLHVSAGPDGLPTSFRAELGTGAPTIALLAEYDALPEIGHGCGHNIIGAAAVGAFIGLSAVMPRMRGRVVLLGTPGEENAAGKQMLLDRGQFSDIDAAVAVHPWSGPDVEGFESIGCRCVAVTFSGTPAHAAQAPWLGRNALDGLVAAYQGLAAMRQHIRTDERIHGLITDGGSHASTVPASAAGRFLVRSPDLVRLEALTARVETVFQGAALMTGTSAESSWDVDDPPNLPMENNPVLAHRYRTHMEARGRTFRPAVESTSFRGGSTDMGNVSLQLASVHPIVGIANADVPLHSSGFAAAACSESADLAVIDAAIGMANLCIDFLVDDAFRRLVQEAFVAATGRTGSQ